MIKSLFVAVTLAVTPLVSSVADTVTLTGNTLGASLFVRPTETGARSFFAVPYNVYQFNVATTGQFTFTLSAADPANYDTFLHLFANSFDPADLSDPVLNFFAANDDLDFNNPGLGSGLTSLTLTAGTTYFMVVDGFFSTDAGAYTATITGPGGINVIPEPSTTALLIGAGLGAVLVVRRRIRNVQA